MRAVIDTSSLLALVRYYLPFDKNNSLKNFFKEKIEIGEIIVLDKVIDESRYVSKGVILTELDFLKNKTVKSAEILPTSKFFSQLENQLCQGVQKNRLNAAEFEIKKGSFLDSADCKQILFCIKDNKNLNFDTAFIVSEETKTENDNKLFKKLPEICDILGIKHRNLPSLLKDYFKINLSDFLE
jgi:hypothetical protein